MKNKKETIKKSKQTFNFEEAQYMLNHKCKFCGIKSNKVFKVKRRWLCKRCIDEDIIQKHVNQKPIPLIQFK